MPAQTPPRLVPCPTCGAPSPFEPANRWRPFCSERCRSVDLGAWASERFRVPEQSTPDSPAGQPLDNNASSDRAPRH